MNYLFKSDNNLMYKTSVRKTHNNLKMKQLIVFFSCILVTIGISGCGQRDKTKILEKYKYEESKTVLNENLNKKIGAWLEEGKICYGIVILRDENGLPKKLKEVQAKVIRIEPDRIKMKSLEEITMAPVKGCSRIGVKKNENWDETEGELFQTKEDAIQFIDNNFPGLRMK